MVFSSLIFLFCFLPVSLVIYYLLSGQWRNLWIVVISLFFYAWGAPRYLFVVLAAMIVDFILAGKIHNAQGVARKRWLALGVSVNVGALLYFKYFNFFVANFNELLNALGMSTHHFMWVALPIGISFFTFHEISYLVDVYRAKKLPFKRLTDYSLYILFFPQLIAGPIIRFSEISDQIADYTRKISSEMILTGFQRFVVGLTKKVMIANVCGAVADRIFTLSESDLTTGTAWIGAIAYTIQIYFDFSGYSDMAIGLARMMGFVFPENFNLPYISQSITEFWRRWHMSLSRWIKDYLYVSLGGNRGSVKRTYLNLVICFLISGFWHGAEWTFILWGAYHGVFLILERVFLLKWLTKAGRILSVAVTFFLTVMGWVVFRSPSITHAGMFYKKLFSFDQHLPLLTLSAEFRFTAIIALVFFFLPLLIHSDKLLSWIYPANYRSNIHAISSIAVSLLLLLLASGALSVSGFNPFIYFRF